VRLCLVAPARIAAEPTAMRRYPGVDFWPNPSRAREVEQREKRPHQRALPEGSTEGEEPPRHTSVWSDSEHGIVEVGVQELRKCRKDLGPCGRVVKSQRPAHIERSAHTEHPHAKSTLSVVDHIQHLVAHLGCTAAMHDAAGKGGGGNGPCANPVDDVIDRLVKRRKHLSRHRATPHRERPARRNLHGVICHRRPRAASGQLAFVDVTGTRLEAARHA
jgi:hypothetical protein